MVALQQPLLKLNVVYLNRAKTTAEKDARPRFVQAYQRFFPKVEHQLYIVNKGFSAAELPAEYALFQNLSPQFLDISDEGFDLEAYRQAALKIGETSNSVIFFMNTHSEPLHQDWLDIVYAAYTSAPNVGLVGCTANFETNWPFLPDFLPAPNFHIRTNGFMIAPQHFLSMFEHYPKLLRNATISSKKDEIVRLYAYQFEAGANSLTRRTQASGLAVLVVGKKGVVRRRNLWRAGLFRCGKQANLLLADNQTRNYQNFSLAKKFYYWIMTYVAFNLLPWQRLRLVIYVLFVSWWWKPLKRRLF